MSNLLTISYGDTTDGAAALEAALQVLADNGAIFEIETVQLGYEMERLEFEKGFDPEGLNKIRHAGILLTASTKNNVAANLRAELGEDFPIFEAKDSSKKAMLSAAKEMLNHLQQNEIAERIENP